MSQIRDVMETHSKSRSDPSPWLMTPLERCWIVLESSWSWKYFFFLQRSWNQILLGGFFDVVATFVFTKSISVFVFFAQMKIV